MGSWSESCGLSGMEINYEDEVYYATLKQVAPNRMGRSYGVLWEFDLLPVRGKYNDGGGIELLEAYNFGGYKLKKGDEYPTPDDVVGDNKPRLEIHARTYMIRADVYDLLLDLPSSQTWKDSDTIGAKVRHACEKIANAYSEMKAQPLRTKGGDFNDLYMKANMKFSDACMREQESGHGNVPNVYQSFEKYGGAFMPFYLRAKMIQEAAGELRKTVQPSVAYAPQGGTPAQLPFLRAILKLVLAEEWRFERDNVVENPNTLEGKTRDLVAALDGLKEFGKEDPDNLPEYFERVDETVEAVREIIDGIN